jgi:DNA-binding transcriptional MerR regulator
VHAGRDLLGLAGRRRSGVRVLQDGFGGHVLWMAQGGRSRIRSFPRRKVRILADYGAARHKTARERSSISSMNKPAGTYSIAELAREFDVTHRAIRFYEDEGLLSPGRDGTRRVYSNRDWVRLKLILRGKRLGFSLAEVHEMLELYDSAPDERPQLEKFVAALAARREQLERQREEIEEVLSEIRAFERQSRKILVSARRRRSSARARQP